MVQRISLDLCLGLSYSTKRIHCRLWENAKKYLVVWPLSVIRLHFALWLPKMAIFTLVFLQALQFFVRLFAGIWAVVCVSLAPIHCVPVV